MTDYGYDFHQTMIAKIEAAQRPLRVRELADFAALYGVDVRDLVYPLTSSVLEADQEIAELTEERERARVHVDAARQQLVVARKDLQDAEDAYRVSAAEVAVLEGRLASLLEQRQKLTSREPDEDRSPAEGSNKAKRDTLGVNESPIASAGAPTVLRILVGAQLRRLREAKSITVGDAGQAIRASGSKIRRFETGRVGFKDRDISDLLTLYGVTDEQERGALRSLARRANVPGWWHDYSDVLPAWFEAYVGLEEVATQIRTYQVQFVPGLLQSEDYARAVTLLGHDAAQPREIERRVRLRMSRQAVLDKPEPLNIWAVVDEAVLRRPVGSPAVMKGQIKHLLELAKLSNVTIQVLPFQASAYSAAGGPFSILRFAEPDLPDVVYLEQLTSALFMDKPEVVGSYITVMERVSAEALSPHETVQLLEKLLEELAS
jgi:transcriptional regulator with XRE-family HTH domain